MKIILNIVVFLVPIYVCSFISRTVFFYDSKIVIVHVVDKDLYLEFEDYLIGVVAGEMPALFSGEALKAQSIASRSYAASEIKDNMINIQSSTNSQVYLTNYELKNKWGNDYDKYYKIISSAVRDTNNKVVKRDGKVLKTYYFSMSNGYTENSINVFGENTFESVESPLENANLKNYEYTITYSEKELLKLLNIGYFEIENIVRNETNHVDKITISNKEYSGVQIRKMLNLRSTDFKFIKNGENYQIITYGYGHGVGMSQYGANEMARSGSDYMQIINHYYKNTIIDNLIE